jgi:hypothetical protein
MLLRLTLLMLFGLAAPAADSSAALNGPITGFVFDQQSRAIRPVLGIPGASYLAGGVVSNLDAAFVSPDGGSALAIADGQLRYYAHLSDPAGVAVDGIIDGTDRVAWAADGSAALLFSSSKIAAQMLSLTGSAPVARQAIDLSGMGGEITALAFDGERLLVGLSAADGGGVYAVTADGAAQRIAAATHPTAIALAGEDLYFSGTGAGQIWQVKSYARQPGVVLFAEGDVVGTPVGMQVSSDHKRLFVADGGGSKLAVFDIEGRWQQQSIELAFAPTRLDRLGQPSLWLLNDGGPSGSPLYLLSDRDNGPAVYFIPAPNAAERDQPSAPTQEIEP